MVRWIRILIPLVLLVSCGARIWNLDVQSVQEQLSQGDHGFISSLDFKVLDPAEIRQLGPGGSWALAKILFKQNRPEDALKFIQIEVQGKQEPWASKSAELAVDWFFKTKDYPNAEIWAKSWLDLSPVDSVRQRSYFESLYWQKKDLQALEILKGWKPGAFPESQERENLLYQLVLEIRLGKLGTPGILDQILQDFEASNLHARLFSFFEEDSKRYTYLSSWQRTLLRFKSHLAAGRIPAAAAEVQKSLSTAKLWVRPGLLMDLEVLNRGPAQALAGIKLFKQIEASLPQSSRFTYHFRLARLHKMAGQWGAALGEFSKALELTKNPEEIQRISWNQLACGFELGLSGFESVLKISPPWTDPYYFSDLIDDQLNTLVAGKRWNDLQQWAKILGDRPSPEDQAMIHNIWARLLDLGWLKSKTDSPQNHWKIAKEKTPYDYEGLMARFFLKEPLVLLQSGPPEENPGVLDPEFQGLRQFGFFEEWGEWARSRGDTLSIAVLRQVVKDLQAKNLYLLSLKILYKVFSRPDFKPQQSDWEALYPRGFKDLVLQVAKEEKMDPWLFFGLIREESHFDPKIKSWVGAVGLSQLMPSTAADVAARMKLKDPDLTDPLTNLTIGGRYFSTRITAFQNPSLAMMAYNAGGGRVKAWQKTLVGFPDDLFVEALPFDETKNYVKKILRSSLMYGLLYGQRTLEQSVFLVFPGLKK